VNICRTLNVCLVVCLLSLGGCSDKSDKTDSTPTAAAPPPPSKNSPTATAPVSQPTKTEAERTLDRANAGNASWQHSAGTMFKFGIGVPKNDTEAVKWFRLAADQGYKWAQHDLGNMYYTARGVPQNYPEAMKWYRLAADQGHLPAQYSLGKGYALGEGVSQDLVEAYARYSVAAIGSLKKGVKERDAVASKLTPDQLAEGQKRATELFEKIGSGK